MKFVVKIVLIAGLSYIAEQFLPWWSVVLCAFLVNLLIPTKGFNAFISGFLGVGILWLVFAWMIDSSTDSILTDKIAQLFELNQSGLVVAATAAIGGLSGGFGALTGSLLRTINQKEVAKPGYYK
ncbi:hypothetical protein [Tunicatimonas pelagia]|uniref:hypothetical protein n=1 Tax=Tunicatimonas pelagia TaxID=931531 RepID=UPI002665FB46|nr:hypothetical protein [Tunicatimonas pelagia]WKN43637.1 hypothetical protein P0M28_01470 [Tunicatimonas pelagia]